MVLAARNKTTAEMFAAGGQSPWWVAGLSGFMTMFSAGTFVVWGGIAYKHGMVAVAINICYGLAALLVGWTVAGKWKQSGIKSPAEYVELRFGRAALHFYTWAIMSFKMIGTAVALYSLCVLMVAIMPLAEGNPLRDAATGNLSLNATIVILGGIVVLYTMIGGLWGVLMTDVLQFIVLNLAVLFVVPLALADVGGVGQFIAKAPAGFMMPTGGGYTWFFLAGWIAIHYFVVGAEWAFVQRYLCVPSPRDARKGTYLFGVLYLVSPLLWLLPPMIQRVRVPLPPGASDELTSLMAESAYIDACQAVLPAGLIGLMLAAMFSATASMVSSQLNVFAGVLTNDILKPWLSGEDERVLVWAGRGFTMLLGAGIVGLALSVRAMGGAEDVIVPAASLMVGPLLAPLLVGLVSRRLPSATVWITAAICCACILLVKVAPLGEGFFSRFPGIQVLGAWSSSLGRSTDIVLGVVLPSIVVLFCLITSHGVSPGWSRLAAVPSTANDIIEPTASRAPAIIVAWSLVACGVMMAMLTGWSAEGRLILGLFSFLLVGLAVAVFSAIGRFSPNKDGVVVDAKA
jgi:Na+/proline symporter